MIGNTAYDVAQRGGREVTRKTNLDIKLKVYAGRPHDAYLR